ncbi:MAG: EAL domain-containing protein [Actinobacteria bacterium]|nr:EAL domain-containing protein [Actinomycetota bacterium]
MGLTPAAPPEDVAKWRLFLQRVNAAYTDADQQQYLHDRAFDVSSAEMHRLTEELRKANDSQLALERDRLQAVFDSVSTGLVVLDGEARLVDLNQAAEQLLGVQAADHRAASLWSVLVMDEASALDLENACRANQLWTRPEILLGLRDGSTVPVSSQFTPLSSAAHGEAGGVLTLTDLTERKEAEFQTEWLASHDQLTGLMNRTAIFDRLTEALGRTRRFGVPCAVLFIDLDHFKLVNDTLGHAVGDELLIAAAKRLEKVVRRVDALGRFGGDEFIVVVERVNDIGVVDELAERIAATMRTSFALGPQGAELAYVSASIGTAISQPDSTAEDLLRDADLALYEAKRHGRDRAMAYDQALRRKVDERVRLERQLRQACDAGDLEVAFQPICSSADSTVVGFEAIVRWQRPGRGWMPQQELITLAEESGTIQRIGQFALERGVAFARSLQGRDGADQRFVSINVSALQIDREGLPEQIAGFMVRGLDSMPLPPGTLRLELTESALLSDPEESEVTVARLGELGVGVMLDDFGTGHGSLTNLRRFRLAGIKIDRSFSAQVRSSAEDRAIIKAVIDLGHALGADVIAEGVDDDDQRSTLTAMGCDALQGEVFSSPLPAEQALGTYSDLSRVRR